MTLTVPLYALNQISEEQMEWLMPGMVKEKTAALLKGLPQRLRRHFVPIPDWAKSFAQAHETRRAVFLRPSAGRRQSNSGLKSIRQISR